MVIKVPSLGSCQLCQCLVVWGAPFWEFITMLLFKDPVWGTFSALFQHGFNGSDWEFYCKSRPLCLTLDP